MALYEETLTSRAFQIIVLIPILAMLAGLYSAYHAGEGFGIMLATTLGISVLLLDVAAIKIEIDEREVRIRGLFGLIVRKTVSIENIAGFEVRKGWMSCYGTIHFTLPAKACVKIRQKKGWTVSFSTNRPENLVEALRALGVPREP
ncbi:hypothetical protein [Thermococcus sp. Bubb.Bath]|uniref:hypothetical protein n=1 Tax=Thermococcus sp. Bubb.Bath TaxID=1638242 RepID=UPI00143AEC4B|nr:hypothetical protein [Thermococcus sp. Bubb.Bath]NJF25527.1 hypothetical protein [Thermococcus sp. Bubb.Bath]